MMYLVVFMTICGIGGKCVTLVDKHSGYLTMTKCREGIDDFTKYLTNDPKGVAGVNKDIGLYNMQRARGFCVNVQSKVPVSDQIEGYTL